MEKVKILKNHHDFYLKELKNVLNFWYEYGYDKINGGFYTYLDQEGKVYCEDKSIWAQGRAVYIFAEAYRLIEPNKQWLEVAEATFSFMQNHAFLNQDKMYFKITKDGRPLQHRRYWFSEAFYIMAALALFQATNLDKYLLEARRIFKVISDKYLGIKEMEPKFNPKNYHLQDLSSSMIFYSIAQMLKNIDTVNKEAYEQVLKLARGNILEKHYQPKVKALLENVTKTGEIEDSPKGRLINPGHSLECAWFLLEEQNLSEEDLKKVINIALWSMDKGWDELAGGIKYFVDAFDKPLEQLEADLKLWWPHSEALIVFLKLYLTTKTDSYFEIYQKVFEFTKTHFIIDDKEWIGYLRYDNTPLSLIKGNLFKGPFHIPRMLMLNYLEIDNYLKNLDT